MIIVDIKSFKYPNETEVLKEISFQVETGEIIGVLGANGVGKTTLLKLLSGVMTLKKGEGSILIDGKSPMEEGGQVAFISEQGTYFKGLTPKEYGDFLQKFFPQFNRAYYNKLIELYQLEDKIIKKMSKGQQAKVEIASGMAKKTSYICMDEPFVGKDIFTRQDFMETLSATLTGEETIFITTHEIDEIENFVDRIMILKGKEIVVDKKIDELRQEGKSIKELLKEVVDHKENKFYSLIEE